MAKWIDRNALGPEGLEQLRVAEQVVAFQALRRRSVVRWMGNEMAVSEEGPSGSPLFHDPSIPYLQMCPLVLEFAEGGQREIHTYLSMRGAWGLCIDVRYGYLPDEGSEEEGSIFRWRVLGELPIGVIENVDLVQDEKGNLTEVFLEMEEARLEIRSGEVYEEDDGLRIVWQDESLLVAVGKK